MTPLWRTAGWGYLRLHEGTVGWGYSRAVLTRWVKRIAGAFSPDDDVYVYFNNDLDAAAPADATTFAHIAARHSLPITRTPA